MSVREATADRADWGQRLREPRAIAIAGIILGLLAFWLVLPPWNIDVIGVPIAVGLMGAAAGVWAFSRGERRLASYAIVASLLAVLGAVWLAGRDEGTVEAVVSTGLLAATLRFATPLIFASVGGIFSERSGVVNIGLEGMMLAGAFFGIYVADKTDSWILGIGGAMFAGGILALIHAVFTITLRADQIVSGFAINLLALGLTGYLFRSLYGTQGTPEVPRIPAVNMPQFVKDIPFIGDVFGSLSVMTWLAVLLVAAAWIVLFKTPIGLRLRSVGEHPRAADTVGISVFRIRYTAVVVSGLLAALGGAYLSFGFGGSFNENMTNGRGYIALAAVIFGKWNPIGALGAALLFGFGFALSIPLQREADISANLVSTLPYVLTLIALVGLIGRSRPPAAVGRPYVKQ